MSDSSSPAKLAHQAVDPAPDEPTKSVDARAGRPASAWKGEAETAAVTASASSSATLISKIAKTNSADAASFSEVSKPRYHVQSVTGSYEIFGVDAIWHNQYIGPRSDFVSMRKQYDCDINLMILLVAKHVSLGLYQVISMNATLHSLTVICACERMQADMPQDMFSDPSM